MKRNTFNRLMEDLQNTEIKTYNEYNDLQKKIACMQLNCV